MKKEEKTLELAPKTREELAREFGWHRNTLARKLKERNIAIPNGLICPKDLVRIYEALGRPKK